MSKKNFIGKGKSTLSLLRQAADVAIQAGDIDKATKLLDLLTKEEERVRNADRIAKEQRLAALRNELTETK